MYSQDIQNSTNHFIVLFQYLDKDQNVVQIYYHNIFYYEVSKDVVYHNLEGSQAVSYTKEHHQRFKKFMVHTKGCLPLVPKFDMDIIETLTYIQLSKVPEILEFSNELKDQWEWVFVLDHEYVKVLVVLHQVERFFFLMRKISAVMGDLKSYIHLVHRFSTMNIPNLDFSTRDKGYTLTQTQHQKSI